MCGPVSHNPVDFEVSYGALDRLLRVCRWCREDLELLGLRVNQAVRLPRVLQDPRLPLTEVFGAVYGLVVAGWKVSGAASLLLNAKVAGNGTRQTRKKRDGESRAPPQPSMDVPLTFLGDFFDEKSLRWGSERKEQCAGAASPIHESATTMMEAVA